AAVAMQYSHVELDSALAFNATFYGDLATGRPVDQAVNRARQAISAALLEQRDWSTPVLYLGTRGGRVLSLADGQPAADPFARLGQAAAETAFAREALGELAKQLRTLTGRLVAIAQARQEVERIRAAGAAVNRLLAGVGGRGAMVSGSQFPRVQQAWE